MRALDRAEQVGHDREVGALRVLEEQRRSAVLDHPAVDLRDLEATHPATELAAELGTEPTRGLRSDQVTERRAEFGPNELEEEPT